MPSPIDSTWPTSATSASVPKLAIWSFRMAEISAGRISMNTPSGNSLHRQLQTPQLALYRCVDHAGAELDDDAADQPRVDADVNRYPAADAAAQLVVQRLSLDLAQGPGSSDLSGDFAAPRRELGEKGLYHRRDGKQPPVGRHNRKEIADQC